MTRFWITLEQGVRLVLKSLDLMQGGEIFVPKIPSMRIMDLVKAVAPECKVRFTGIRPGEKIHEVLLSEDEARQTVQWEDLFVIQPIGEFSGADRWLHAKPVPEGFSFTSDQNDQWLSVADLQEMAGEPVPVS